VSEVAILVGLPGAGKTSFYRARLAGSHVHVSKDVIGHGKDAGRRQLELVTQALRERRSVAVDNTNPRAEDRAPLIALARAGGARVVAYVLDTTPKESAAAESGRERAVSACRTSPCSSRPSACSPRPPPKGSTPSIASAPKAAASTVVIEP
jgi:predicted kinase